MYKAQGLGSTVEDALRVTNVVADHIFWLRARGLAW